MTANVSSLASAGSLYEQLIGQVIAIESQPRLRLRTEQTEQNVFKGVLSDLSSTVSRLDTLLTQFRDPLQSPFAARSATVAEDAGFTASASDEAAPGQSTVRVDRLARADARLSKQIASAGTDLAAFFVDPGDPGDPGGPLGVPPPTPPTPDTIGARSFSIQVAQSEGDPVDIAVSYTPDEGATNDDILAGVAAAINDAVEAARTAGDLEAGTGAAASVVRETGDTARLSLRSSATGFGNRLSFTDTDGLLAELEVDRTDVRTGTGGGAVYAVGTGQADSDLSAALTIDGLQIYRDANTIDDALSGVTLTLSSVSEAESTLDVGPDVSGMRKQVEDFIAAYNEVSTFIGSRSTVDPEGEDRGAFVGDSGMRSFRLGMRGDLARTVDDAGDLTSLADLGITTNRDGTLVLDDPSALDEALAASPGAVGALFGGEDGLAARLQSRTEALLGDSGTIEQRKDIIDQRVERLDAQIERWDVRLERREETLRAQFAQLEEITLQAQSQQASILGLFVF
ncbi:MAG: flagellar filament capping protein FliD [Bacteroidota bacterium]